MTTFEQVMENVNELSTNERALMAHHLISSLDEKQDDNAQKVWMEVVDRRSAEMKSGKVQGLSWDEVEEIVKHT
ncbi:hypothetical protein SPONL_840 [uncultured Candidatus Thioglobus sp.]|nr:hypothetical protein SPONL_840 [uncultured Candidatus Thioglobus sp.]